MIALMGVVLVVTGVGLLMLAEDGHPASQTDLRWLAVVFEVVSAFGTVSAVTEVEIQSALSSSFTDFEDAIQHFAAKAEGDVRAINTRNKADYSASEIAV